MLTLAETAAGGDADALALGLEGGGDGMGEDGEDGAGSVAEEKPAWARAIEAQLLLYASGQVG